MSDKDKLQDMLDNLINQKPEQAQVAFHDYLQDRMQGVIGGNSEEVSTEETPDEE